MVKPATVLYAERRVAVRRTTVAGVVGGDQSLHAVSDQRMDTAFFVWGCMDRFGVPLHNCQ